MPTDSLVALTARDSMWFAPGTNWRYDNTGYLLLGILLDRVTGETIPKSCRREARSPPRSFQHLLL